MLQSGKVLFSALALKNLNAADPSSLEPDTLNLEKSEIRFAVARLRHKRMSSPARSESPTHHFISLNG